MPEYEEGVFSPDELFFDYQVNPRTRTIYLGSHSKDEDEAEAESGPDTGVGWLMAGRLIKAMHVLESDGDEPITILMNTPGGDWHHGMAIYDELRYHRGSHLTIVAYGYARSMSSIILQAADRRILMPSTTLMLHHGLCTHTGVSGTVIAWADHERDVILPLMYEIYQEGMAWAGKKVSIKKVKKICGDADHLFTATEAVERGLADEIFGPKSEPF